jgi:magnesium chelatase family protein
MEDGVVTLARAARTLTYPSRFTLAGALNPCPCGFFNDRRRECICTPQQISRYLSKISGPLLDRIDLQVEVGALTSDEIASLTPAEPSARIRERVESARARQRDRFRRTNGEMTPRDLRRHCHLDASSKRLLVAAIERLGLSARAHDRILKVARTIADLAGMEQIDAAHVAEAVQYRALDRAYFRTG